MLMMVMLVVMLVVMKAALGAEGLGVWSRSGVSVGEGGRA